MIRVVVAVLSLAAGLGVSAAQTRAVPQGATAQAGAGTSENAEPTGQATASSDSRRPTPARSGNCVGAVSRLGVTFTLSKIGVVPILNEERRIPIEEWHVDDLVAARVSVFLAQRAVIRRVPWSRAAYSVLERSRQSSPLFRDNEATMADVAHALVQAAGMHCHDMSSSPGTASRTAAPG